ncbi:thiolase domain-containing protein [Streptomyces sp. NRRL S-813]|uniref:thiolase domain-containing protein n=1 Tax=Streptomyces sp. NRRL S-813 TaxID=1463919 RepID=UPI0004C1FF1B|nr:thiolase domain-containing protein [Streptomyces sp. NRRL S-813]
MTSDTYLTGWAHTVFGKSSPETTVEDLMAEVSTAAVADAGLEVGDVDAAFVGVFNSGFSRQSFEAALLGAGRPELARTPASRHENACATGSAALFAAMDFVASGRGRVALVVGAEKMTSVGKEVINDTLLAASYLPLEADAGSFAGIFARLADMYADRYGFPREALGLIAAKNHHNGVANPWAQMRRDLGVEFCSVPSEKNPYTAGRLLRTDCSLVSDGAAAVVVTSEGVARAARRRVRVAGRAQANEPFAISSRPDPLAFDGARRAFKAALTEAGTDLTGLDLIETHDCFTLAELLHYEAFGLAEPGKGGTVIAEGVTQREGRLPVNVSGGLKSKGHPIGATGVSQQVMAALQLTGEAGEMQLPRAERAAVFNMGGSAVANYATVLEAA